MKKFVLLIFMVFILCLEGCTKHDIPVQVNNQGKDSFSVELLFEKDGVKVYRFRDEDEYRYFTIGNGSFQPQEQTRVISNGKSTITYHDYDGALSN